MNTMRSLLATLVLAASALGSGAANADTLLVDRVNREAQGIGPSRGMTMDAVVARFGEPASRLAAVGGNRPQHPPITRWIYGDFIVYFEHDKVIDAVPNRSTAQEQGPAPVK
jgi:hypothetical protein